MKTGIALLFLLAATSCSYQPLIANLAVSPDVVISETRRTIEIRPATVPVASVALLFYPGGLVDNHVYNQLLARFAATGHLVVVVKMPANLAVLDSDAGATVIQGYPSIKQWVVAGHSLGGSMAASLVNRHHDAFKGIIFMDSYPADSDNLHDWQGAVLSLFSSSAKVSDPERMAKTLSLIPPASWLTAENRAYPATLSNYSVLHAINGGSHSLFGAYGPQDGDAEPTVSREDFQAEVLDYMREFYAMNGWSIE